MENSGNFGLNNQAPMPQRARKGFPMNSNAGKSDASMKNEAEATPSLKKPRLNGQDNQNEDPKGSNQNSNSGGNNNLDGMLKSRYRYRNNNSDKIQGGNDGNPDAGNASDKAKASNREDARGSGQVQGQGPGPAQLNNNSNFGGGGGVRPSNQNLGGQGQGRDLNQGNGNRGGGQGRAPLVQNSIFGGGGGGQGNAQDSRGQGQERDLDRGNGNRGGGGGFRGNQNDQGLRSVSNQFLGGQGLEVGQDRGGGNGSRGGDNRNSRDRRLRAAARGNRVGGSSKYNSDDNFIIQRLNGLSGPTLDLEPIAVPAEKKFSGRSRLYVGNLTSTTTEEDLRAMFKPYGEIDEIFSNFAKNFTFLKVDYHANAVKAKRALDGTLHHGRQLRIRFALNATILRVTNLSPYVSNELLHKAFEIFGPIERAVITVDDRGKHTGEGMVEFEKKSSASMCLRICNEKCFFLTASLRPCLVTAVQVNDEDDGMPEKSFNKQSSAFVKERSLGPRFAELNSFEHNYGLQWKELDDLFKAKQEDLQRELKMEEYKLEAYMERARFEQETELLRQELRKRELDAERLRQDWERRHQNEMMLRPRLMENSMQDNSSDLLRQARQLKSLLDQHDSGYAGNNSGNGSFINPFDSYGDNNMPFDNPFDPFRDTNKASNMPEKSTDRGLNNEAYNGASFFNNQGGNQREDNNGDFNNPGMRGIY